MLIRLGWARLFVAGAALGAAVVASAQSWDSEQRGWLNGRSATPADLLAPDPYAPDYRGDRYINEYSRQNQPYGTYSDPATPYYPQTQWQSQPQQPSVYDSRQAPPRQNYGQRPTYGNAYGQQNYGNAPRVITIPNSRVGSSVVLGGTVVPYKEVTLSAQVPGRVEYIAGTEGDFFEEDEVLVAIDDDELLAKRRQVLAEMATAESAMRDARVQYSRELWAPSRQSPSRMPGMGMPSMFDQFFTRNMGDMVGLGNPQLERSADLYSHGTKVSQAQANIQKARSALEEVDAKLRDARSVAPFSGVIIDKLVEVGDTVQPGQPMLKFADTTYLQLAVDVPARLAPGLDIGMMLPVKLDIRDRRVEGRVAQVFPVADARRHTVTVKLDLPKGTPGGPGMYAEVMVPDVNAQVRDLPVLPYSAIVWRGSLPGVFVVDETGKAELRLIRLGESTGNQTVSVLSGVQAGERIYLDPPPGMTSDWTRDNNAQGRGREGQ